MKQEVVLEKIVQQKPSLKPLENKENIDISGLVPVGRKTGHKRNEKQPIESSKLSYEGAPKLNLSFKE